MPEPLIFGNRSMDTVRHPFSDAFRRVPALHPATPFEKGVDPKTLSADGQHTFNGEAKNPVCRSRFSLGTDLWTPVAVPSLTLFAGPLPCNPATPFEKGVDPKTFSVGGQHTFYGKAKNPVCRSR